MNKYGILLLLFLLPACGEITNYFSNGEEKVQQEKAKTESYYTCSMHPQIKEDEPGKCPICHMNLTKVTVEQDHSLKHVENEETKSNLWQCENYPDVTSEKKEVCPIDGSPMVRVQPQQKDVGEIVGEVRLRKSQLSHFRPDFFPVTEMKMQKDVRLLGSVLQSENKESNITARIGGRVEKVFVKSTGSYIKRGEPVIKIYSPKLITTGEEYLIARKSYEQNKTKEFQDMLQQSEKRLRLWGIRSYQYERWYKTGTVPQKITIYSPVSGVVQKRNAIVGRYFKEGQNFFELSDLSEVWVELDVYEHDSNLIELGQKVKLEFIAIPGEIIEGEIDFISPVLDKESRTLKVRTTVKNPKGKLKPGMVAEAKIDLELEGMPLVVPRNAIIDTGKKKIVWLKDSDSSYRAKTIQTGYESEGYVEVLKGLSEGDEVVMEGNFLLDAQAQLFGGYEEFNKDKSNNAHNH